MNMTNPYSLTSHQVGEGRVPSRPRRGYIGNLLQRLILYHSERGDFELCFKTLALKHFDGFDGKNWIKIPEMIGFILKTGSLSDFIYPNCLTNDSY